MKVGWLLLGLLSTAVCKETLFPGHFTNDFVVEIDGGPNVAELVATAKGFTIVEQLSGFDDVYHFRHSAISHRSKRSAKNHIQSLLSEPNVKHVEQQKILLRVKRGTVREKRRIEHTKKLAEPKFLQSRDSVDGKSFKRGIEHHVSVTDMGIQFNDPEFSRMWYLINKGQMGGPSGYDINVLPVWRKNITGKGVVVCILDDGIDHNHADLAPNYDPEASGDFNDERDENNDPQPEGDLSENSHGTKCAGEVAAVANNSVCGVGVAYNAKIGGVRLLDGLVTDMLEGKALLFQNKHIDIYSASWGPSDDGKTMEGPGKYATEALKKAVTEGRNGLGSLFVWATGNGGGKQDDCSCDGYVSSIYTIPIGAINAKGLSTYYSEICPAVFAVIFVGGSHLPPDDEGYEDPPVTVITTDIGSDGSDGCTDHFQGTSAAAPLAAGCVALVLQANPKLSWRDMQNIIVETARVPNQNEPGWIINGGGYHVNHRFGFGSLDCGQMVEAAQNWKSVPEQRRCEVNANNEKQSIPAFDSINQTLSVDGCDGGDDQIDRLEHVQVFVKLSHPVRGQVRIVIISPHGTPSEILSVRKLDQETTGIDWTFLTVHNWGEDPKGDWTLMVEDTGDSGGGELLEWSMTLWGTKGNQKTGNNGQSVTVKGSGEKDQSRNRQEKDAEHAAEAKGQADAHAPDKLELHEIMKAETKESDDVNIVDNSNEPDDIEEESNSIYNRLVHILNARNEDILEKRELVAEVLGKTHNINKEPPMKENTRTYNDHYYPHNDAKIQHKKELPAFKRKVNAENLKDNYLRSIEKSESDAALIKAINMLDEKIKEAEIRRKEYQALEERKKKEKENTEFAELVYLLTRMLEEE